MFSRARWRLALWFVGALALILVVISGAVYFTTRTALFSQVNDDLRSRAGREAGPLATRLLDAARQGQPFRDVAIGPASTAGGYFYALAGIDGTLLINTANVDPKGLADPSALEQALREGPVFKDTHSSEGENLRVYVSPVQGPRGQNLFLEVGRSTEPEKDALRRLFFILVAGGGAGLFLALGGGFFLAGRTLAPIRIAMDRQRTFVADASHELRTPLSLIRASAELLKRHPSKSVQTNMISVEDIIQETDRLSSLVGQMLTLTQTDAGQALLCPQDVDLSELTANAVHQMRLLAEPKQMTIDIQANSPLKVKGDSACLREMLMILLDNAIKYSDPGTSVRVLLQPHHGKAWLQVSDRGPGIPPEALPHIFDRFYRVDKARSREMGGAGLGLTIAKGIVESHKGTIRVESALGVGTTVTVELPALPSKGEARDPSPCSG